MTTPLEQRAWKAANAIDETGRVPSNLSDLLRECGDAILGLKHGRPRERQRRQPPVAVAAQSRTLPADLADLSRLTIKEVCSLVGRSESSVRELIRTGRFPAPDYRDGARCARWSAGLVRRWLQETTR